MSILVGVHGIAQQQLGRHQLLERWAPALADGIERSTGRPVQVPALEVAYYGDLFLARDPDGRAKGSDVGDDAGWAGVTEADIRDVVAAAGEVLSGEELTAAGEEAAKAKGFGRVPLPLQAVVAALDRRFGAHAGALFVGELRQVRRYLSDPDLKVQADARVADAVTDECRVLIGHSLGSVAAFEFLRLHPRRRLDLFLTLGSPLGLQAIRQGMPNPQFGAAEGIPPNLAAWVNLRDPRDPVACAGSLATRWTRIRDDLVDNQKSAHSIERYLSKRQAGDAVLTAVPELAS